jgi:predicted GIY-YIG superfamily endonuclease
MGVHVSQLPQDPKDLLNEISNKLIPNFTWYLYVLLLVNEYYYVGITIKPEERILNHFDGKGANFTKRNAPIKLIELYSLNEIDRKSAYKKETLKTKEYRNIYGIDKVIGGKYLYFKKSKNILDTPL